MNARVRRVASALARKRAAAPSREKTKRTVRKAASIATPAESAKRYETVALVLQGGGALGAYQAGVYAGLSEAGIAPNWIAGISIGALNTAVIAGNAPERRVAQLEAFWRTICEPGVFPPLPAPLEAAILNGPESGRIAYSAWQAWRALIEGQKGFFTPRWPQPLPTAMGDPAHASYYDTSALRSTLERFVDFDRINSREIRVSVGAVNVHTGNFVYFDTEYHPGTVIELSEVAGPKGRLFDLIRESAQGWDGQDPVRPFPDLSRL